ncbi:thiamine pyrophosphate-binding protein [bacterium]|nr:thiamine pyrophosphate-binding protein [bacterium]MBU1994483.1 thiamine pyrophosphate-binding protein [bacterium]
MKLTDYMVEVLAQEGIKTVFGVTGGAAVHFFDSIDKNGKIEAVYTHHEQAAACAAEAYARIKGLGACIVTTGPGGTNALTGLAAAYLDSIPCIFISGQQRFEHTNHKSPLRQVGSQQMDIVTLVESISKYAVMIDNPQKIKYEMQKAIHIAKSGRPGPVWIDVPMDFQWSEITPSELESFEAKDERPKIQKGSFEKLLEMIGQSKRPLFVVGNGVRLSGGKEEINTLVKNLNIPFVTTWNSSDMFGAENPLNCGRLGIAGQRGANLAVQNSDLILSIGSHLSIPLTGTRFEQFAKDAKIVMIDIDKEEIEHETVRVDFSIHCDAKEFLNSFIHFLEDKKFASDFGMWNDVCLKYGTYNKSKSQESAYIDPYEYLDLLSDELSEEDIIAVDGGGTALYMPFQSMCLKEGQRMIVSAGIGSMGIGLPEAIGACFAHDKKRVLCIIGDGSMQFNIHELQTIFHHQLPVKILLINNEGYLAIRHTQGAFLDERYAGSSDKGGISMPDYSKVVPAYGIAYKRITVKDDISTSIKEFLASDKPYVCEIMTSPEQELIPRMAFKKQEDGSLASTTLEDMAPFLDADELKSLMITQSRV